MNMIREKLGEPVEMTWAEADKKGIPMESIQDDSVKSIWVFGDCHFYEEHIDGRFYCIVGNQDIIDADRTKVEDFLWDHWTKYEADYDGKDEIVRANYGPTDKPEDEHTHYPYPEFDMDGSRFDPNRFNAGGMD